MQPISFHSWDFIPVKIIFNGNFGLLGLVGTTCRSSEAAQQRGPTIHIMNQKLKAATAIFGCSGGL